MHQTVKEFLSRPEPAGPLYFTEADAIRTVLWHSCDYIKLSVPVELDAWIHLNAPEHWPMFTTRLAQYLDELRLFPLCGKLIDAYPNRHLAELETQVAMKWDGFLPRRVRDQGRRQDETDIARRWKYDHMSREQNPLTSAALGLLFQYTVTKGLVNTAKNLLSLVELDHDPNFWPMYRHTVLNGVLFALLDRRDLPDYHALRSTLTGPFGYLRESADQALDARFYEEATCRVLQVDLELKDGSREEFRSALRVVMDHVCAGNWWEEMEKRATSSPVYKYMRKGLYPRSTVEGAFDFLPLGVTPCHKKNFVDPQSRSTYVRTAARCG